MLEGNVWDGGVVLLDETTGARLHSRGRGCGVSALCVSAGDAMVFAGGDDGVVEVLSSDSLELLTLWRAHDNIVTRIAQSTHLGGHCVTVGWEGSLSFWDVAKMQFDAPVHCQLGAHNGPISDCAVSPSNNNVVATAGRDGFLRLWDSRQEARNGCSSEIFNLGGAASALSFASTSDPFALAAGLEDGSVVLVDSRSAGSSGGGGVLANVPLHQARVRRLRPVPTRPCTWVSAADDTMVLASTLGGGGGGSTSLAARRVTQHADYVADVALRIAAADGRVAVFSASTDKTLRLTFLS